MLRIECLIENTLFMNDSVNPHRKWNDEKSILEMRKNVLSGPGKEVASFIASLPNFEECHKMIDFAGNIGYYSEAIIEKNQDLYSYVFDLPEVCNMASTLRSRNNVSDRIIYNGFDFNAGETFGEEYDLFFISNFLYRYNEKEDLKNFLKKVNASMKRGGWFVSNHKATVSEEERQSHLVSVKNGSKVPLHYLDENMLKEALSEAGFEFFVKQECCSSSSFPTLLLAARKVNS